MSNLVGLLTDIVEENIYVIFKNSDGAMLGNKIMFDSTVKKVLPVSSADCDR